MGKYVTTYQKPADAIQLLNEEVTSVAEAITKVTKSPGVFVTEPREGRFEVRTLDGVLAEFSMSPMPGCCGVVIAHNSAVTPKFRRKGLGTLLLTAKMSVARRLGYGQMIATVLTNNIGEQALLSKLGFVRAGEFRNPKTGNLVRTFIVNL